MESLQERLLELEITEKENALKQSKKPESLISIFDKYFRTLASLLALLAGIIALFQQDRTEAAQSNITGAQSSLENTQKQIIERQKLLDRAGLFLWENSEIIKAKFDPFDIPISVLGFSDNREKLWNTYATCLAYYNNNQQTVGLYPEHIAADKYDFPSTTPEARIACLKFMQATKGN